MEDGVILKKLDVCFRRTDKTPGGLHSYGWKIANRQPPTTLTPAECVAKFTELFTKSGYRVVK
jgi:hypothetical protein